MIGKLFHEPLKLFSSVRCFPGCRKLKQRKQQSGSHSKDLVVNHKFATARNVNITATNCLTTSETNATFVPTLTCNGRGGAGESSANKGTGVTLKTHTAANPPNNSTMPSRFLQIRPKLRKGDTSVPKTPQPSPLHSKDSLWTPSPMGSSGSVTTVDKKIKGLVKQCSLQTLDAEALKACNIIQFLNVAEEEACEILEKNKLNFEPFRIRALEESEREIEEYRETSQANLKACYDKFREETEAEYEALSTPLPAERSDSSELYNDQIETAADHVLKEVLLVTFALPRNFIYSASEGVSNERSQVF